MLTKIGPLPFPLAHSTISIRIDDPLCAGCCVFLTWSENVIFASKDGVEKFFSVGDKLAVLRRSGELGGLGSQSCSRVMVCEVASLSNLSSQNQVIRAIK